MLDLIAWSDATVCMVINFDNSGFFLSPSIVTDLDILYFLGTFSKFQKHQLASPCLFVRRYARIRLPLDGFS
jgi:hypothetical protein